MIPLGDVDRRPVRFPIVTALIIAVNVIVFIIELIDGPPFILKWSLIPAAVSSGHRLITLLTAMFMHASWVHILGNMVFLWAFGPEIEDTMGRTRYLIFYLLGGLAAFFAQVFASPHSTVPNLGASGAIAAVMGAFLVTFPRDRIRTVLFIFIFFTVTVIPAVVLILIWFFLTIFNEVGSLISRHGAVGGVAYVAHIGGIVFGALFGRIFEIGGPLSRRRNAARYYPRQ